MSTLEEFAAEACALLGLPPETAETGLVLGLAREVAHNVVRPAAPLTAYLLGVAVGRGGDPQRMSRELVDLAHRYTGHMADGE